MSPLVTALHQRGMLAHSSLFITIIAQLPKKTYWKLIIF
ncbi:hypothetical protein ELS84_2949 [Enterococcus faecalis]|nr:hypothetical protein ELS84_2949 [Enterococcus faecalis]